MNEKGMGAIVLVAAALSGVAWTVLGGWDVPPGVIPPVTDTAAGPDGICGTADDNPAHFGPDLACGGGDDGQQMFSTMSVGLFTSTDVSCTGEPPGQRSAQAELTTVHTKDPINDNCKIEWTLKNTSPGGAFGGRGCIVSLSAEAPTELKQAFAALPPPLAPTQSISAERQVDCDSTIVPRQMKITFNPETDPIDWLEEVECFLLLGLAPLIAPFGSDPSDVLLVQFLLKEPVTIETMPTYTIPNAPVLQDLEVWAQVYMKNAAAFPDDPVQFSNGLHVVLGSPELPEAYGAGSGIDLWAGQPALLGGVLDMDFAIEGL